jgi:serine/threonine-protein kinase
MGVVYLAQHVTLGKKAAIKVLRPALSSNQDIVSRFFNEARAVTAVRNPGIVDVYDFGFLEDRTAYIIMEYLEGESLAARLRRNRPAIPWTLTVVRAIARALQAAHEHGIVHRDLKPDNMFLVPDADLPAGERVKLLDFGIAKLTHDVGDASHTTTGTVMGTPTYMAPEQCRGAGAVDQRADLYSLGCVAYEMLCGQPPFVADGPGDVIARHLYFEPQPPRSRRAEIPAELEEIVLRLLKKEPRARYSTAADLVRAIDQLSVAPAPGAAPSKPLATEFVATIPVVRDTTLNGAASSSLSLGKDERSRRLGIVTAAVTVAVAALMLAWFLAHGRHGEESASGAGVALSTGSSGSTGSSAAALPVSAATAPRLAERTDGASHPLVAAVIERAPRSAGVPPGGVSGGTVVPPDPGPQRSAPPGPAEQRESENAADPERSADPVPAGARAGQPEAAAMTTSNPDGESDAARQDMRRSHDPVKASSGRSTTPRSRVGDATGRQHAAASLDVGGSRMVGPKSGADANPSKVRSPGGAVEPGSESATAAAPLGAECSSAAFAGVLDTKAPSSRAVKDAGARLGKCRRAMDPAVYEDIHRRLIELY